MSVQVASLKERAFAYIKAHPGCRFYQMDAALGNAHYFRELDRALQRLRRAGRVYYRNGWWAGQPEPEGP